jgi:hypothetical protein
MRDRKLYINEYDDAWERLVEQIVFGFHSLDSLLRLFPPMKSQHMGPFRYVQDDKTLDQPLELTKFGASSSVDLRRGNIEEHTIFIYEFVKSYMKTTASYFFRRLSELPDVTGNKLEGGDQPFTPDRLLEANEKCPFDFEGDEPPTIHIFPHAEIEITSCMMFAKSASALVFIHPDKAEKIDPAVWTEGQKKRHREIMSRKRLEHDAAKRTRRLS